MESGKWEVGSGKFLGGEEEKLKIEKLKIENYFGGGGDPARG